MTSYVINHQVTLVTTTCCSCGVVFAFPERLKASLKRTHATFFCPSGHSLHFPDKTEEERLRTRVHEMELENTRLTNDVRQKEKHLARVLKEQKLAKARTAAGVCPCCNRTFQQLARHMKNKHPEQAA